MMMRVTNKMLVNELNRNLSNNLWRMDKLQRQLSTTRRINTPSDDPAGLVKSLRLRTNLIEGEQYLRNIGESVSFLQTTDGALHNINEVMQKARVLTVQAASTNNPQAYSAIAQEIRELNEQLELIANTTNGSKHIFAGSNVTEAPLQNGEWRGNQKDLEAEIGVGVKIPINIKIKDFFMGRLKDLYVDPLSGINPDKLEAQGLQEGDYLVSTANTLPPSEADEWRSLMGADNNPGAFFFNSAAEAAPIAVGNAATQQDSRYSGSLKIEVTAVDEAANTLTVNISGRVAIDSGAYQDINIAGLTMDMAAANDGAILTITAAQLAAGGLPGATQDLVIWNNSGAALGGIDDANPEFAVGNQTYIALSSAEANAVEAQSYLSSVPNNKAFFYEGDSTPARLGIGTAANQNDTPFSGSLLIEATRINPGDNTAVVNIKGHVYQSDGSYKYVEMEEVVIDMTRAAGEAILTIPASKLPGATQDLVIWNNSISGSALGGIYPYPGDPGVPADQLKYPLAVGDKTVISFSSPQTLPMNRVGINLQYPDTNGNKIDGGTFNFNRDAGSLNYDTEDFKFFTLNAKTGISYDGSITVEESQFAAVDRAVAFSYQMGVFEFLNDVSQKIELGRIPDVGNTLAGADIRLEEMLMHRSTVGARINRLELQDSRLTSTQLNFTELLSKNEDADLAEVIMNLKMQENVYNASLAAGARIIQPTLLDFLR